NLSLPPSSTRLEFGSDKGMSPECSTTMGESEAPIGDLDLGRARGQYVMRGRAASHQMECRRGVSRFMTGAVDNDKTPHVSAWLARLLRPIHTVFMTTFFRLRVVGRENIPKTGPVILAPTHRSRWDPMVLGCATRRLMRSMASHDEFVGI